MTNSLPTGSAPAEVLRCTVNLTKPAPYVACPRCGKDDNFHELQLKDTWQHVAGLHADGNADDYDSFDYDGDIVTGYSCSCGWSQVTGMSTAECARIDAFVADVLASMPRVKS